MSKPAFETQAIDLKNLFRLTVHGFNICMIPILAGGDRNEVFFR